VKSDRGTIAPLIAIYLAIILLSVFGSVAVVTALVAANRVQGVAEMTVLYAHDRAVENGVPDQALLRPAAAKFLSLAPSVRKLSIIGFNTRVDFESSKLRLCARYINPLGVGVDSAIICREASARSFIID